MESFSWLSSRSLHFTSQGKYQLSFPPECPLLLHFVEFSIDHSLTPSYHDHLEITYVYEGGGKFTVENKVYPVDRGDAVLVGNREFHLMQANYGQHTKAIAIHFMPELVYSAGSPLLDFEYLRPFYYRTATFVNKIPAAALSKYPMMNLITAIHDEIQSRPRDYPLAVKTYLNQILFIMTRHYQAAGTDANSHDQRLKDVERLRCVLEFLRNSFQEKLSLEQVSGVACMSPSYFCRFFKKVTGNSLTDYVVRLRVDRAMELLLSTDRSVTEIAFEVGFDSHSYFDRVFRRMTNLSPIEFRQRIEI